MVDVLKKKFCHLFSHVAAQTVLPASGAKAGAGLCPKSGRGGCIRFVFVSGGGASPSTELMPSAWCGCSAVTAVPGQLLLESPGTTITCALCQGCPSPPGLLQAGHGFCLSYVLWESRE